MKPTKRDIEALRCIAEMFGCSFIIFNDDGANYYPENHSIELGKRFDRNMFFSAFFHELGHHICNISNIYPIYYKGDLRARFKINFVKTTRYALRAELKTDEVGERLCREWFPEVNYIKTYTKDKESYDYLFQYFTSFCRF